MARLEREVTTTKWLIKIKVQDHKEKCLTLLLWTSLAQNAELQSTSFHSNRPKKRTEHSENFIATTATNKEQRTDRAMVDSEEEEDSNFAIQTKKASTRCWSFFVFLVSLGGIEPPTFWTATKRSIHWATRTIRVVHRVYYMRNNLSSVSTMLCSCFTSSMFCNRASRITTGSSSWIGMWT